MHISHLVVLKFLSFQFVAGSSYLVLPKRQEIIGDTTTSLFGEGGVGIGPNGVATPGSSGAALGAAAGTTTSSTGQVNSASAPAAQVVAQPAVSQVGSTSTSSESAAQVVAQPEVGSTSSAALQQIVPQGGVASSPTLGTASTSTSQGDQATSATITTPISSGKSQIDPVASNQFQFTDAGGVPIILPPAASTSQAAQTAQGAQTGGQIGPALQQPQVTQGQVATDVQQPQVTQGQVATALQQPQGVQTGETAQTPQTVVGNGKAAVANPEPQVQSESSNTAVLPEAPAIAA